MMIKLTAYGVATVLGCGYLPLAPGTWGSLAALILFYFVPQANLIWAAALILLFLIGTAAASFIEKDSGTHDPGLIVIDEFVGQGLALLYLPRLWWVWLLAFVIFRLLDIYKPFFIDKLQNLPAGWGVMMDDVLAGIYTNLIIQLILFTGIKI